MDALWNAIRLTVLYQRMGGVGDRVAWLRVVAPKSFRWWLLKQLILLEDES